MRMIRFAENVQQLRLFCARNVGKSAEPVVGDLAAVFAEIVQCLSQRFRQAVRAVFLAQCTFRVQVSAEIVVWSERRQNAERDRGVSRDFFVPFQRVRRIVRRAEHADVHLFKERNRIVGFQLFFCFLPDSRRSLRRQRCGYLKIPLQFQMRPMVQRAADQLRHDLCPLLEFFVLRRVAGDIPFVHAAGAHGAPFVMVCCQPQLRQIFVPLPLRNFLRRQMVVIVVNRLMLCVLVKQRPSHVIFQQKILVHKCFHSQSSNFSRLIHSPSAGFGI